MSLPATLDRRRDVRHLPNSESARLQLDLDAASVTPWLAADVRNTPFGSPWVAYSEQHGWHPRWASAVARRYAERLAERTCQEPAVARQQMLEQWSQELERLRALPPKDHARTAGAVTECLRQISTLLGADRPHMQVQFHMGEVAVSDLAKLSDDELRARIAILKAKEEEESRDG